MLRILKKNNLSRNTEGNPKSTDSISPISTIIGLYENNGHIHAYLTTAYTNRSSTNKIMAALKRFKTTCYIQRKHAATWTVVRVRLRLDLYVARRNCIYFILL